MKGRIWWIADDQDDLDSWIKAWEGKPITIVKVDPHDDGSTRLSVIFELEMETAKELLGYEVEACEWLDDEDDEEGEADIRTEAPLRSI